MATLLATVAVPAWAVLALGVGVVLLGEWALRRFPWLAKSNIPAPIVAGIVVSLSLLALGELRPGALFIQGNIANPYWLWPVLPQWDFSVPRPTDVERPLLILFFTCIGLNASWRVAREGGRPLLIYLALSAGVAVMQLVGGVFTAQLLGQSPLLGAMASNVSLMGGFGTAAGFAPEFEKAGLQGAATIGIAAAAFGVITGGVLAGLVGGRLVLKSHALNPRPDYTSIALPTYSGFLGEWSELARNVRPAAVHFLILVGCMKIGAFASAWAESHGITFPVYMGAMVVAGIFRNLHDLSGQRWLSLDTVDSLGSVALSWLLAVVMIDLQLSQLASAALPMLVILLVQVLLLAGLTYWAVFRLMGRDYDAAVLSAGMIGFGLGATSNALASMRVLTRRFGPSPRAFLIVPIVGAFLIDFLNALLTTGALNLYTP